MLRQYFDRNEKLEIFLTCFCNILCYMGDISLIIQQVQLNLSPFERLYLYFIFIFKTSNHTLTESTIKTNGKQGNLEKAGYKSG